MNRTLRLGLRLLLRDEDPAWDRLMRRRLGRAERGLPLSLTVPVPPEALAPLPPVESTATGPRPATATLAAVLLWVLGAVIAAHAAVELGRPIVDVVTAPAADGMAAMVAYLVAGFLGLLLGAMLAVAAAHAYAGWRIIRGVNWGFVEGLVAAAVGAMLAAAQWGLDADGRVAVTLPLVGSLVAYLAVILLLVSARPWFGDLRFPLDPDRGPWWLRWGARRLP